MTPVLLGEALPPGPGRRAPGCLPSGSAEVSEILHAIAGSDVSGETASYSCGGRTRARRSATTSAKHTMDELIGIIIFSGFMLVVVVGLVVNVLLALYRERGQRKEGHEPAGGRTGE